MWRKRLIQRNMPALRLKRVLSLYYGDLPIREMHRGRKRTSYIPFLLNQETRSDVIPVRLRFSDTLPQARQPISHRRNEEEFVSFQYFFLLKRRKEEEENRKRAISPFVYKSSLYRNSTYCSGSPFTRKIRIKRIELPTHYSEVNHRTLKAVVSYGPNIGHIPHDIRLKDPNLPLRSGNGRGQNI
ncbi:hypothetical protein PVAP13_J683478 [Panicum virgatum]|nr:hypothetical protein PVAP13_J683478 [Panicum virgatum]